MDRSRAGRKVCCAVLVSREALRASRGHDTEWDGLAGVQEFDYASFARVLVSMREERTEGSRSVQSSREEGKRK